MYHIIYVNVSCTVQYVIYVCNQFVQYHVTIRTVLLAVSSVYPGTVAV
jgi:hypothetical protein